MYKAVAMGVVALSLVGVAAIIKHNKNKANKPEEKELVNPCSGCPNEGTEACTCCCDAEESEFDDAIENAEEVVDNENTTDKVTDSEFASKAGKELEDKIKEFDNFMNDLTDKFSDLSEKLGSKAKDAAEKLDTITEYIKKDSEVIKAILKVKPEDSSEDVDEWDEDVDDDEWNDDEEWYNDLDAIDEDDEWEDTDDEEYFCDECCEEEEYEVPDTDDEFYDESEVVTDEQEYGADTDVDNGTDDFFNPADVDEENKTYEESDEDAGDFEV